MNVNSLFVSIEKLIYILCLSISEENLEGKEIWKKMGENVLTCLPK
jgi:hypothetical protein